MCAAVVVKHMTVFELEQCIEEYGKEVYSFCLHLTGVREWADGSISAYISVLRRYEDGTITCVDYVPKDLDFQP